MKYMDIWAKPQRQRARSTSVGSVRLPRRVKDWPEEARAAFKALKNDLWKWSKRHEKDGSRKGLALIAYKAVKDEWEGRPDPRANMEIIETKTLEDTWQALSNFVSQS